MRLLGYLNLMMGLFLFFALSGIVSWDWFASRGSQLIVFALSAVLVGNGIYLAFAADAIRDRIR